MSKISQREARRLRKRVNELEDLENRRRSYWITDFPGTSLGSIDLIGNSRMLGRMEGVRMVGHAVVAVATHGKTSVEMYALPVAKGKE